jgi:hypothetical protein
MFIERYSHGILQAVMPVTTMWLPTVSFANADT